MIFAKLIGALIQRKDMPLFVEVLIEQSKAGL
jgi:hypothetical protein